MSLFESVLSDVNNIASVVTASASVAISLAAYKFNKRESHRDLAKDLQESRDKVNSSYDAWITNITMEKEDKEGKEESTYLLDLFKSNSTSLINVIEASSTVQPQLTNWLHALDGQMNVVGEMRSKLRDWPQEEGLVDDTKWASGFINLLLDAVKDSITPFTPSVDDTELVDDDFWIVLDNPVLINGDGEANPTIDDDTFEQARKKWMPRDIKNREQKLRLQTLIDYKVIAENAIAFILYGELIYKPVDRQEQFRTINMVILNSLFKRFSSLADKQINTILG
ncbi:hypothetical protein [Bifidobacterium polysaccharolyticum]|uniref:Uncharacterized protein n=1 Tax=Bifidobacterium polysaccharolyticum TaxID=2750967 RepID=A0ABS0QXW8_9BIFI|nr:hypothetical protein [Bifidobacterium polysaccharolyticum]MBI0106449.1 hypothetical protein [Bifidobacterium polysaccharolyticum]